MSDLNKRLARVEQRLQPQPKWVVLWPDDEDAEIKLAEAEAHGATVIRVVWVDASDAHH